MVLNSLMCTYTVGFPLLTLVFWKNNVIFVIFTAVGSFSFIVSSVFLFIGLLRLNNATKGLKDFIINKTAISWLLLSTWLLVIANLGMCYFAPRLKNHPKQYFYMVRAQILIYLVSEIIMIGIIKTIVTKVLVSRDSQVQDLNTIATSLMT